MKKKVLGVIAVVAVAAIAGYNVYTSQNDVKLSDLVLSNVEALANANRKRCTGELRQLSHLFHRPAYTGEKRGTCRPEL